MDAEELDDPAVPTPWEWASERRLKAGTVFETMERLATAAADLRAAALAPLTALLDAPRSNEDAIRAYECAVGWGKNIDQRYGCPATGGPEGSLAAEFGPHRELELESITAPVQHIEFPILDSRDALSSRLTSKRITCAVPFPKTVSARLKQLDTSHRTALVLLGPIPNRFWYSLARQIERFYKSPRGYVFSLFDSQPTYLGRDTWESFAAVLREHYLVTRTKSLQLAAWVISGVESFREALLPTITRRGYASKNRVCVSVSIAGVPRDVFISGAMQALLARLGTGERAIEYRATVCDLMQRIPELGSLIVLAAEEKRSSKKSENQSAYALNPVMKGRILV